MILRYAISRFFNLCLPLYSSLLNIWIPCCRYSATKTNIHNICACVRCKWRSRCQALLLAFNWIALNTTLFRLISLPFYFSFKCIFLLLRLCRCGWKTLIADVKRWHSLSYILMDWWYIKRRDTKWLSTHTKPFSVLVALGQWRRIPSRLIRINKDIRN